MRVYRLETDILMGRRAGTATALVLIGVTGRDQLDGSAIQPDYVLESVRDLVRVLRLRNAQGREQ